MSASSTRLLVLGAVRIFQPAHGYLVRRELLSWGVESWAALNPGSIYNMLRTLSRDGMLAEVEGDAGPGPARVGYQLTLDGEQAFLNLLTRALWEIDERDPHLLPAALSFLPMLTRTQAAEALEARATAIELRVKAVEARSRMTLEKKLAPPHTYELFEYEIAHFTGELGWVRAARKRVEADHYRFAGEPAAELGPVGGHWYGALEKPG
ncbi:MAG TPA: PadR family transcriptional regulator [Mycobacteriales bacterium]|nr:PadR family transcriptional regulator [Mycobacteriales bacterium]